MSTTPQPPIDWTDEPPTEPGHYWYRERKNPKRKRVAHIRGHKGILWVTISSYSFSRPRDYIGLIQWWPEPIQQPPQPSGDSG